MAKYIRKGVKQGIKMGHMSQESLAQNTFDVVPVKEDTEIETRAGMTLITAGNYILTNPDGSKQGMTPQDLEYQYERG